MLHPLVKAQPPCQSPTPWREAQKWKKVEFFCLFCTKFPPYVYEGDLKAKGAHTLGRSADCPSTVTTPLK